MINVTLKVRHFYYIADLIGGLPADLFFKLLNNMKAACAGKEYEDYATVETTVEQIQRIYSMLASKPEGEANMINTEMNNVLLGQMQDMIGQGNAEWIELAGKIQAIREQNWDKTDAAITRGETLLA